MPEQEALPKFKYHPNPVSTGSVMISNAVCIVYGRERGFVYTGPAYGTAPELDGEFLFCPWCIADGSAHKRFDVEFVASVGWYGNSEWERVDPEIEDEVTHRTPGFATWQEDSWWTHCADAAEFLGPAGYKELTSQWPEAIPAMREFCAAWMNDEDWAVWLRALHREGRQTAYVFRCRHCGQYGGFWDID